MTLKVSLLLSLTALLLAACASATPTAVPASPTSSPDANSVAQPTASTPDANSVAQPTALPPASGDDLARTDSQASVDFVVTPLNLSAPGETLDFDISLNTHSVDLSWDLAAQSVLSSDTGLEVNGLEWPVGSGHHYEGTLTFPAKTADGKPLLEGAETLTLTIRDTGVTERVFVWELSK